MMKHLLTTLLISLLLLHFSTIALATPINQDSLQQVRIDSAKKATLDSVYQNNTQIGLAREVSLQAHKSIDRTLETMKWAFTIFGSIIAIAAALGAVEFFNIKRRARKLLNEVETKTEKALQVAQQAETVEQKIQKIHNSADEVSELSSKMDEINEKIEELKKLENYLNGIKKKVLRDAEEMQEKVAEITKISLDKKSQLTEEQKETLDKVVANIKLKELLGLELTAEDYFNKAYDLHEEGKLEVAIVGYSKAIELNPNYIDAYNSRGRAHGNLKEYDKAITDYNKAIQLDPNNTSTYYNRGNTYFKLNKYEQAIRDYNKAIQLDPNYKKSYTNLAYTHFEIDELEKAIEYFNVVLKINDKDANSHCGLGISYFQLGDVEKAKVAYQKAIDLDKRYNGQFQELTENYLYSEKQLNIMQQLVDLLQGN